MAKDLGKRTDFRIHPIFSDCMLLPGVDPPIELLARMKFRPLTCDNYSGRSDQPKGSVTMPIESASSRYHRPKAVYPPQNAIGQEWPMALVRKGDTLWHIVKRNYGGSDTQIYEAVKAIEENNNIDHSDGKIFPGQKIKMLSGEQLEKIYPELIDYD